MNDQPVEKKKRKKRTSYPVKVLADGKIFRGSDCYREGKFLVLQSATGTVFFNMDSLLKPLEVVGRVSTPAVLTGVSPGNGQQTGPVVSGPMSLHFNKMRNLALGSMATNPVQQTTAEES